jgi:4-diphosphocytidyl-2-C-methyl-D-erythritol kinase
MNAFQPPVAALPLSVRAPAKINLGLFVGPTRADGRHELVSVMQSISLADELTLEWLERAGAAGSGAPAGAAGSEVPADATTDEILCPGVVGPAAENLAARTLAQFRAATGWDAPPLRLRIDKHIPVAAGLGGGSADAAAALRLAAAASGLGDEQLLLELARELGADVPAQVSPGRWLATGAGERLEALPDPIPTFGVLVLSLAQTLSTADVYAAHDRLAATHSRATHSGGSEARAIRDRADLAEHRRLLHGAYDLGMALPADGQLLHNDLQDAARALCPEIDRALAQAHEAGAPIAFVSGSGPTVIGLFPRASGPAAAQRAVAALAGREPAPLVAEPVGEEFGRVLGLPVRHN